MNSSKFQDKFLLLRLKKKDPDAFAIVYNQYVTPIYRFIYFKVSSRQDAEDLTSEVFMKIWNYISETEDEIENLRALLYRTARNLVIDHYRRNARRDVTNDMELMENIVDDKQQSLLSQVDTNIDMQSIEKVLRQMKDEYREVIVLKYLGEMSIAEIAKALDKTKGSVRVTLHRALKIAKELSDKDSKKDNKNG